MARVSNTAPAFVAAVELDALTALVKRFTVEIGGRNGSAAGSGVIWHSDGLVVTNAHVARESRARVTLADGHTLDGELIARDTARDLALVRLDATGLPSAPVGDAEALRAGSLVMALGHPLGVAHALSLGVVHTVTTVRGTPRWIAADVQLAPGNSGGPLVDTQGRVVGINAMIAGGLGLAIPTSVVRAFLRDAARGGAITLSHPLAA